MAQFPARIPSPARKGSVNILRFGRVLTIVGFLLLRGGLEAQSNSGIVASNSVTTSLASVTSAVPAGAGAVINDCLPETFASNPIPPNGGVGTGPSLQIELCKGTWVTQLPLVIDQSDELIGAGKPNSSYTSSGTLVRADPNNFPIALAPPSAPSLAHTAASTGLSAGAYTVSTTYLVSLESAGQTPLVISSLSCSSGTVTVTTVAAHNFIAGQLVTLSGLSLNAYNGVFSVVSVPTTTTFTYSVSSCAGTPVGGSVSGSNLQANESLSLEDTLPSASSTVTISMGDNIQVGPVSAPATIGQCVSGCSATYHANGLSPVGFVSYILAPMQSAPHLRGPTSCTGTGAQVIVVNGVKIGCSIGATAVFAPSTPFQDTGIYAPLVNGTNPVVVIGSQSLGDAGPSRFGALLRDLGIDCSGIAGVGVYNAGGQERSGVFSVDVINTSNASTYTNANSGGCLQADLYWKSPGSQNSTIQSVAAGSAGGLGAFTNYSPWIPIVMDARNGPVARQIKDVTIMPSQVTNNQWAVSEGIYLTGGTAAGIDISAIHCEDLEACITVDNGAIPVISAVSLPTAAQTVEGAGIHITSSAGAVELHDIQSGPNKSLQDDNVAPVTLTGFSISRNNSNIVTVTVGNTLSVGEMINVSGVTGSTVSFNGRFVVCGSAAGCTNPNTSAFQYVQVGIVETGTASSASITYAPQNAQNIALYSISPSGSGGSTNRTKLTSLSNTATVESMITFPGLSGAVNFDMSSANTVELTLNGNVTVSTIINAAIGQHLTVIICQQSGNSYTLKWPTTVRGAPSPNVQPAGGMCIAQRFVYDGTSLFAESAATSSE